MRKMKYNNNNKIIRSQKGSLSLEQVLYIGAVVAISTGLFTFYGNISNYLENVGFSSSPSNLGNINNSSTE